MPATLAFFMGTGCDTDFFLTAVHCLVNARAGGNHDKTQIVTQAIERFKAGFAGIKIQLGLQGRADLTGGAQHFNFLGGQATRDYDGLPCGQALSA